MKHILVVRSDDRSPSFARTDRFGKQWVQHNAQSQTLRAIVPAIVSEIGNGGSVGITMSSARGWESFADPDAASIPSGVHVIAIAPIEGPSLNADLSAVRLWGVIHWSDPSKPPVLADKLCQKKIGEWITMYFHDEELRSWSAPKGAMKAELWVRPHWNLPAMFPELFGKKIVDPETVPVKPVPTPPVVEGKEELANVRIQYSPRTRWRVFGLNNTELTRNLPTKADAEDYMNKYLESHGFSVKQ